MKGCPRSGRRYHTYYHRKGDYRLHLGSSRLAIQLDCCCPPYSGWLLGPPPPQNSLLQHFLHNLVQCPPFGKWRPKTRMDLRTAYIDSSMEWANHSRWIYIRRSHAYRYCHHLRSVFLSGIVFPKLLSIPCHLGHQRKNTCTRVSCTWCQAWSMIVSICRKLYWHFGNVTMILYST